VNTFDAAVAAFVDQVGDTDPVTVTGLGTRGGPVPGVRSVTPPSGIDWIQPAEMTVHCAAGTPVADLAAALAEHGQCVAVPDGGTIGGALAVGRSGIRRLGWGPVRDTVLQARYVSSEGHLVKAGGPTVKNVSGFDLCRLLVGSRGTVGFLAELILRTRPLPVGDRWFTSERDPSELLRELYRPTSVLWDGRTTWVLLDGHADDVDAQAGNCGLTPTDGPPELPAHRWSMPPSDIFALDARDAGSFVAEVGVGVVHRDRPAPTPPIDPTIRALHQRIAVEFDPRGRLNPGVDVLAPA
jgi:FAD/FMN-containing dehydrogenase